MPAPARARPPAHKGAGKENVLTRKIGPLPAWAWTAIAAAIVLLYVVLHGKSSSSSQGGGKGHGLATALVPPVILHGRRGHDRDHHRHKHGGGVDPGGPRKGREGPEREWLGKKTGSGHPGP